MATIMCGSVGISLTLMNQLTIIVRSVQKKYVKQVSVVPNLA